MPNPTNKQLVIQSLKRLHKAKTQVLFKLTGLRQKKRDILASEASLKDQLTTIKQKMAWEIDRNGASLNDQS
jgi:hypothetical protein